MDILQLKEQMEEIMTNAVCRVYAVSGAQKAGQEKYEIVLPEQAGRVLSRDFWKSISDYNENVSDLMEISGEAMMGKWGRLEKLLQNAVAYERGNIEGIRKCDLCVCEAEYGDKRYYLCARQNGSIKTLLGQKTVVLENNGELVIQSLNNVRLMHTAVDFIVDMEEKRIIFLDSQSYEAIVRGDSAKEIFVRRNLNIIDKWKFIANVSFIKERVFQKNVYSNLYRIFNRQGDLDRLRKISPAKFKWFLIHEYSDRFTEADFAEEKLIITSHNMEAVLKILVKGIDIMWVERDDEEWMDEEDTIFPVRIIKMCEKIVHGFRLKENHQIRRKRQIERFLEILDAACKSDLPENYDREEHMKNKLEKQNEETFRYFRFNDAKLYSKSQNGETTWFEENEENFEKIYANEKERELLIKGLCKEQVYKLLLSGNPIFD